MTVAAAASRAGDGPAFDRELADLPASARWREWMRRAEAVIFAAAAPVDRETLARVVGTDCSIDLLIDDLNEELRERPYEIVAVAVAGGWQYRTRPATRRRSARAPRRPARRRQTFPAWKRRR